MTLLQALTTVLSMNAPVFTTGDAAACLRLSRGHASVILARLATFGQIVRLRRAVWALPE